MAFVFPWAHVSPELRPLVVASAKNLLACGVVRAEMERLEQSLVGNTRNMTPAELLERIQRHHVEIEVLESLESAFKELANRE